MPDKTGFFGKSPARGDFLSRRLPPGFAEPWADFLGEMMQTSRAQLGEAWQAAWLEAPVWHFALGAGIAGPAPHLGLTFPSVDKVGRFFPFTVLAPCAPAGMAAESWWAEAESLALTALRDDFDPEALDTGLQALGLPTTPATDPPGQGRSQWRCQQSGFATSGLPSGSQAALLVPPVSAGPHHGINEAV